MAKAKEVATINPKDQALMLAIEQAVTAGNLAALNPEQKLFYYNQVCESVGLNPLTRPLDFIQLNGKLVLYAKKDATDQLRKIHGVSIIKIERDIVGEKGNEQCIITAHARDKDGKEDCDVGALPLPVTGEARSNAIMKAITKAKRRVTLSICGLGLNDESEVEGLPGAKVDPIDMGNRSEGQAKALKDKFTAPAKQEDAPPPVPEAAKKKPKEPEVLPPVEKSAEVKKPSEPSIAEHGETTVPFGVHNGKKLDDLSEDEIREIAQHFRQNPKMGPRLQAFKKQFDDYVRGFDNLVHADEPEEIPPPPPELDDGFDEEPAGAPDYQKIALDRLAKAQNEGELRAAWTQLFADAKDPNKINAPGLPPAEATKFNNAAKAARDKRKAELGIGKAAQ